MQRVLFHSTIFGPIHSRRLGVSLGVNLDPDDGKVCSFDCLYCEAGFNSQGTGTTGLPPRKLVAERLEAKLKAMSEAGDRLDVITFSGNGEPTMHPDFPGIVDDVIALRDRYYPDVKISVLTNSTRLDRPEVAAALMKVDNNIVKLDSAITSTMRQIDRPVSDTFTSEKAIADIAPFGDNCIVQTMFVRGEWDGQKFDNTTPREVEALVQAYRCIGPRQVMIYSIDRVTPAKTLTKVGADELNRIADIIRRDAGVEVSVAC